MKLKKKYKTISLIFYILAALFLLYAIFTIVQVVMYLGSVESSGMYVQINLSDKISYFITQVFPVIFYTVSLFGIGYLIDFLGSTQKEEATDRFPRPVITETAPDEGYTPEVDEDETEEETIKMPEALEDETEESFVPRPPVTFDEIDVLDLGAEVDEDGATEVVIEEMEVTLTEEPDETTEELVEETVEESDNTEEKTEDKEDEREDKEESKK